MIWCSLSTLADAVKKIGLEYFAWLDSPSSCITVFYFLPSKTKNEKMTVRGILKFASLLATTL